VGSWKVCRGAGGGGVVVCISSWSQQLYLGKLLAVAGGVDQLNPFLMFHRARESRGFPNVA